MTFLPANFLLALLGVKILFSHQAIYEKRMAVLVHGLSERSESSSSSSSSNVKRRGKEESAQTFAPLNAAGSITLLSQVAVPVLLQCHIEKNHAASRRYCVSYSPPLDHFEHVVLPLLCTHFGADVSVSVAKIGYFPRGGGEVELSVVPSGLNPLRMLEQGEIVSVKAILRTFGYPASSQVLADMADLIEGRSFSDCRSRDQNHKKNRVAVEVECNVHFRCRKKNQHTERRSCGDGGSVGKKVPKEKASGPGERKRRPHFLFSLRPRQPLAASFANALGQRIGSRGT